MTPAEQHDRRHADRRTELGFPEMSCPRCDQPQGHVHLCATCRTDERRTSDRRTNPSGKDMA